MKIEFDIDVDKYPQLSDYNETELSTLTKHIFIEWYKDNHETNVKLQDRVCQEIHQSLMPTVTEMQNINRELFGLSKVSQKKGEIIENNIFDIFKTHFPDYALTPTNQLPHHGDAEVVSPSNVKFLLELKNYTNAVDVKEINKLKYDMQTNNIKYGLFISIKSGICGKKVVDYEKFADNSFIIFLSFVNDPSKIYTGLLLLDHIANLDGALCIPETDELEIKIKDGLEEMMNVLDVFASVKSKFSLMEGTIKAAMDNVYIALREEEIKLKEQINKIWFNITREIEKTKINTVPKDKHHTIMLRLNDIFEECGIELKEKEDNIWELNKDDTVLGELKKKRVAVDIVWSEPEMTLRMSNTDACYEMVKTLCK